MTAELTRAQTDVCTAANATATTLAAVPHAGLTNSCGSQAGEAIWHISATNKAVCCVPEQALPGSIRQPLYVQHASSSALLHDTKKYEVHMKHACILHEIWNTYERDSPFTRNVIFI